jgi:dTDP-glucose pyrophosphorylase
MKDLKPLLVPPTATVKEAMARLDQSHEQILLVAGKGRALIGTLTDGDIRRHILAEGDLKDPVSIVCNKNPRTVEAGAPASQVRQLMLEKRIRQVPVVDARRCVIDVLRWEDILGNGSGPKGDPLGVPVVIMAGGKGMRLDPFTRILPKPLIPMDDKPLVQNIMDRFRDFGCTRFYMTVNYKAQMIRSYFDGDETRGLYDIHYVHEKEETGTAGSLALLAPKLRGDFFLSNCDVVVKADYADMLKFHREKGNVITIVASMQSVRVPYGVIELEKDGGLKQLREKPEYDLLANTGFYLLSEKVKRHFPKKTAFDMPHLIAAVRAGGGAVGVYPVSQGAWNDVGQWAEYFRNMVAAKTHPGT